MEHLTLLSKKERLQVGRLREKLEKNLGSISDMTRLPGALFVVDIIREHIAIKEAQKLNIPIFAMVDTNSDPREVEYVIPSNDDASKSITKILENITPAIQEGLAERNSEKENSKEEAKVEATKEETKVEAKVETKEETKVEAKVEAKEETKVEAKVEAKEETKVKKAKVEAKLKQKLKQKKKNSQRLNLKTNNLYHNNLIIFSNHGKNNSCRSK